MSRYIDADKLHYSRIRIIHPDGTIGGWNAVVMSAEINNAPTVDVEEVRHGYWIPEHLGDCICSICGGKYSVCGGLCGDYNYCPGCGAKMDKEKEVKNERV